VGSYGNKNNITFRNNKMDVEEIDVEEIFNLAQISAWNR